VPRRAVDHGGLFELDLGIVSKEPRSWKSANGTELVAYTSTRPAERVEEAAARRAAGRAAPALATVGNICVASSVPLHGLLADELEARERVGRRRRDGHGDDRRHQRTRRGELQSCANEEPPPLAVGRRCDEVISSDELASGRGARAWSTRPPPAENASATTQKIGIHGEARRP
jgi:hypothetical protein